MQLGSPATPVIKKEVEKALSQLEVKGQFPCLAFIEPRINF